MIREQIRIDIKRTLNRYRDIKAEREQLAEELERLEALMASPSSSNWDGGPRGSDVSRPVENKSLQHMELEQRYKAQLDALISAQIRIEMMIEELEPTERRLARFRYIEGLNWDDVCEAMRYSWRQTHRIHSRLLDKLVEAELERRSNT